MCCLACKISGKLLKQLTERHTHATIHSNSAFGKHVKLLKEFTAIKHWFYNLMHRENFYSFKRREEFGVLNEGQLEREGFDLQSICCNFPFGDILKTVEVAILFRSFRVV